MRNLTLKQRIFIDVFSGNGTDACRKAGYKGSDNVLAQQARVNLMNPHIAERIEQRNKESNAGYIADRETRQRFWSTVIEQLKVSF